jgi:copper chaperone CopZ
MKNLLVSVFFSFGLILSLAQDSQYNAQMNIKIDGMHCAMGCAKSIESKLNNIYGISALVDFSKSSATIEYDSSLLSEAQIIDVVNTMQDGKFAATSAPLKACSKGKKCCQKTGKVLASCDNKSKGCCASNKSQSATK